MKGKISFVVAGDAVGKGRSRHRHVTTKAGKSFDMEYTPAKTRSYEQIVRLEYERQVGHEMFDKDAALAMKVTVYKQIPKSMTKKNRARVLTGELRPGRKPDISNIIKSIEDGLNKVAYMDDNQIVDQHGTSWYGDVPYTLIEIEEIGKRE